MHRSKSDGECRRVFKRHVLKDGDHPTPIANGIVGVAHRFRVALLGGEPAMFVWLVLGWAVENWGPKHE
jgi:hypothetical protein